MFIGIKQVEGLGIIFKINDGKINVEEEGIDEVMSKFLYDSDMVLVLNEFCKVGVEVISVNNYRVVLWFGVVCVWVFI